MQRVEGELGQQILSFVVNTEIGAQTTLAIEQIEQFLLILPLKWLRGVAVKENVLVLKNQVVVKYRILI